MDTSCHEVDRVLTDSPMEHVLGSWIPNTHAPSAFEEDVARLIRRVEVPIFLVRDSGKYAVAEGGRAVFGETPENGALALLGVVPACLPCRLGDGEFRTDHGLRCAYVAGAMANGIGSEAVVTAMSRAGMLGFFGAAGLSLSRIEAAIDGIQTEIHDGAFGFNLIHSPNEPALEDAVVDLYLRRGIRLVEASAYLALTEAVVRYRVRGIHRDRSGQVIAPNRIIAKVSREEVAAKFFSPPPEKMLEQLVAAGEITREQAQMAREIPVAQDITGEADSGGHTDNRPAIALLPTLLALRDRMQAEFGYACRLRVGLAGGISTPASVAAAFAMGASYVLTGSVNQACVEAGTSDEVRRMLADARQADVTMAPAADMFEMGVKLQVLKRGTMFPMRAAKLYELYRNWPSLDAIPEAERRKLEQTVFRMPIEQVWNETQSFFAERDVRQIERAERDPRHKMALVFRWYLGQSSNWANSGVSSRKVDYQIWCGPAMGAFNEWVRGSVLEAPEHRSVVAIARNIMYGAAVYIRAASLRQQGFPVPDGAMHVTPRPVEELERYFV